MSVMSPVNETVRGLRTYMAGASWLKSHPKHMMFVFIPIVLGLIFLMVGWNVFMGYEEIIFQWAMFDKPEAWWGIALYWVVKTFLYVAFVLLGLVACVLIMNIFASPIYEYISMVVEADITGKPAPELSLKDSFKLMGEELKKVCFILSISIALLLIPGINIISTFITAFLIGWDFYDYSLARRGWTFSERVRFVGKDFWAVMGFGFWLVIPFVQFILMPLAIAGGTMLSVKALQKNNLLEKGLANAKE